MVSLEIHKNGENVPLTGRETGVAVMMSVSEAQKRNDEAWEIVDRAYSENWRRGKLLRAVYAAEEASRELARVRDDSAALRNVAEVQS